MRLVFYFFGIKKKRKKEGSNVFKVKGRYVIAWWLLPLIYLPGLGFIYSFIGSDAQWYWYDISYYLYFQLSWLLLLISLLIFNKVDWKKMVSKPDYSDLSPALKLTTFTFFFSLLSSYIIFLPLSYIRAPASWFRWRSGFWHSYVHHIPKDTNSNYLNYLPCTI